MLRGSLPASLQASRQRIEQRASSDLRRAHEAVVQAEAEVHRAEARLTRIHRGWQDGVLDDNDYRSQREQVSGEPEAARAALERSQAHVERIEQTSVSTDAEQQLLDLLAAIKRAVADGVGRAPNLNALRNVIGQLFESVELVQGQWPDVIGVGHVAGGFIPDERPWPALIEDRGRRSYARLLPRVRWSAVELTPMPTGQLTPVPPRPQ